MTLSSSSISSPIVETLYREALVLADEARAVFELPGDNGDPQDQAQTRLARSCEALRTTTRLMHALAWLLNQRAFLAGELSEFQLRRHGRLPAPQPATDPAQLALLDEATIEVVQQSRALFDRIARLDRGWRGHEAAEEHPVDHLRARLGRAFTA